MALSKEQYRAFNELYQRGSLSEAQKKSFETLKSRGAFNQFLPTKEKMPYVERLKEPEQPELGPFITIEEKQRFEERQRGLETPKQMFTGELRKTPRTEALPEFRETEEIQTLTDRPISDQLKMTAGLLTTFSPEGQMNVIKEAIPEATFSQDEKGNIFVKVGDTESVLNRPGFSSQDAMQAITGTLLAFPASKIASLGKSVLTRLGIGASGAGATEAGIQKVSQLAGSKQPLEPGKIALAGAIGGLSEAPGGARQVMQGRAAKRLGAAVEEIPAVRESVQVAKEASEKTGIPLYQAQQTLVPSMVEKQAFVAQLPAGTRKSMSALRKQNEAAADAVQNFMESIAPPESVVTGAERFRTAAQNAIEATKTIRKEKTSGLFNDAFKNKSPVEIGNIRTLIKDKIDDFPTGGEVSNSIKKIAGFLKGEQTLKKLQNVKLEIDQMISKVGEGSLGNTTKAQLVDIKNNLLDTMDAVSPQYKIAREAFIKESPAVEKISESIIGKVAAFDDVNLKRLSRTIFDPAETNPQVVLNAKKTIMAQDPEAWKQLLRVELERRIGNIATDISDGGIGAIENVPRMLEKAIYGNPKQKAILYKAVDGEQLKNLKYLETALKRAKLGRPGGSQTAIREEIKKELRGGVPQAIRNVFKKPIAVLAETGEETAFNKRVSALAEALYSTEYVKPMQKIRKMNPNTVAAGKAMAQLLKNIELKETKTGE